MSSLSSKFAIFPERGRKILVAGLSGAGMTTIKEILLKTQEKSYVEEIFGTADSEKMNLLINRIVIPIIDLGGQKTFSKEYLDDFGPSMFMDTFAFVFIVDFDNRSTWKGATQYFNRCLFKLMAYSPKAEYFVLLHKIDLARELQNFDELLDELKDMFQEESQHRINFFQTTSKEEWTVIDSFGRIFELIYPRLARSDLVEGRSIGFIEEFASTHDIERALAEELSKDTISESIEEEIQNVTETTRVSEEQPAKPDEDEHEVVEELQDMMKQALKPDPSKITSTYLRERTAGDPALLQKLGDIMKDAVKDDGRARGEGESSDENE